MRKKRILFWAATAALSVLAFASTIFTIYSVFHYLAIPNENEQINLEDTIISDINLSNITGGQKSLMCTAESDDADYAYTHEAEGITFASYSSTYDKERLRKLANELLKNSYGDEIEFLSKVEVVLDENKEISTVYTPVYKNNQLSLNVNGILPENSVFNRTYEFSIITLYLPNEDVDARDYAYVLSREYGKHFVKHNFNLSFTEADIDSGYYKMRALEYEDRILLADSEEVDENQRKWLLSEIAAHDYIYFLGSETVRSIEEFDDTLGKHHHNVYGTGTLILSDVLPYFVQCINGVPHINPAIDMPIESARLYEYFCCYTKSEIEPAAIPEETVNLDKEIFLITQPEETSHQSTESRFATEIEEIGTLGLDVKKASYYQQFITWEQPFKDSGVIYTLIAYDEYDNVVAIVKTTDGDDNPAASLGVYDNHGFLAFRYDVKDENDFHYELGDIIRFRVSVTFPDGTILLSDYVEKVY